jgi:hypothetical protein
MAMWQVGTLHHYTGDDGADLMRLEAFLPGLEIVPPGPGRPGELEPCDLWWPDGPKLRPLNQVERRIAAAIGGKP